MHSAPRTCSDRAVLESVYLEKSDWAHILGRQYKTILLLAQVMLQAEWSSNGEQESSAYNNIHYLDGQETGSMSVPCSGGV